MSIFTNSHSHYVWLTFCTVWKHPFNSSFASNILVFRVFRCFLPTLPPTLLQECFSMSANACPFAVLFISFILYFINLSIYYLGKVSFLHRVEATFYHISPLSPKYYSV